LDRTDVKKLMGRGEGLKRDCFRGRENYLTNLSGVHKQGGEEEIVKGCFETLFRDSTTKKRRRREV